MWPLEVVALWFGCPMECARLCFIQMGFKRLPSSVVADGFVSLGTNTNCGSYWGTSLGVVDCGRDKIIPTCGL